MLQEDDSCRYPLQGKVCSYRDLEVTEMDSVKNAEKTKCDDKQRDRKMIPDLYLLIKDK